MSRWLIGRGKVEVNFVEESPGHTRVELEHRNLDRFGDQAQAMWALFDSPGGWARILGDFQALAA